MWGMGCEVWGVRYEGEGGCEPVLIDDAVNCTA